MHLTLCVCFDICIVVSGAMRSAHSVEYLIPPPYDPSRRSTVSSSSMSLLSSMIGGGILSLPFAVSRCGVIVGVVLLAALSVASTFSVYIIIAAARRTGTETLDDIAEVAFGRAGRFVSRALLVTLLYAAVVAYCILIRDCMQTLLAMTVPADADSHLLRNVLLFVATALAVPFAIRPPHDQTAVSSAAITSIVLITAVFIYKAATADVAAVSNVPLLPQSAAAVSDGYCIIAGAYVCQFNVLSLHSRLNDPTRQRIKQFISLTMTSCLVLYTAMAISGITLYGADVSGNALLDGAVDDGALIFARALLTVTLWCTLPLLVHPLTHTTKQTAERITQYGSVDAALVSPPDADDADDAAVDFDQRSSGAGQTLTTAAVLLSAYAISLYVSSVATLWLVLGCTVSLLIAYVLPAACYIKIRYNKPLNARMAAAYGMLVTGTVSVLACSITTAGTHLSSLV